MCLQQIIIELIFHQYTICGDAISSFVNCSDYTRPSEDAIKDQKTGNKSYEIRVACVEMDPIILFETRMCARTTIAMFQAPNLQFLSAAAAVTSPSTDSCCKICVTVNSHITCCRRTPTSPRRRLYWLRTGDRCPDPVTVTRLLWYVNCLCTCWRAVRKLFTNSGLTRNLRQTFRNCSEHHGSFSFRSTTPGPSLQS